MGLLLCVVGGALLAGVLTGGTVERLSRVPLRGWPLAVAAVGVAVVAALLARLDGVVGETAAVAGPVLAATCLLLLVLRNRAVEGIPLMAAGLVLNAVVVGVNGAMPVSLYAQARAGISTGPLAAEAGRHVLAGPETELRFLGDVIPVPLPLRPETVSPGDVLIVAGAGLLVLAGMHRRLEDDDLAEYENAELISRRS